eukprot:SAG22_NODE_13675_length_398_cov_1.023411_1_plen_50_part_01
MRKSGLVELLAFGTAAPPSPLERLRTIATRLRQQLDGSGGGGGGGPAVAA